MDKVFIGIPAFGPQTAAFWLPLARECAQLWKQEIEIVDYTDIHVSGSMMVDVNRNYIVDRFLKSKAEWLKWLDADNVDKAYSIRRLLDTRKSLVTGIYVKREKEAEPVVYQKDQNGDYVSMGEYERGQILPVASAGLGGTLVHRQVFEDIQKNYRMFDLSTGGGVEVVHKDDIIGDVFDDMIHDHDGKVVNGVQHRRLRAVVKDKPFPYFMLKDGRTEDLGFFELCARSGHQLWCDTGVEIGHINDKVYMPLDGQKWRMEHGA